jgi:UDP-glucose 4-epimerase
LAEQPAITFAPPRIGEVTHYVADIAKARALLGYTPTTPLREGVRKAVAWAVDWWDKPAKHGG